MKRIFSIALASAFALTACESRSLTTRGTMRPAHSVVKVFFADPTLVTVVLDEREKIGTYNISDACGNPPLGEPAVHGVGWSDQEVLLLYGNSCVATVNLTSKQIRCGGCD